MANLDLLRREALMKLVGIPGAKLSSRLEDTVIREETASEKGSIRYHYETLIVRWTSEYRRDCQRPVSQTLGRRSDCNLQILQTLKFCF
jgi:hypothetical protein